MVPPNVYREDARRKLSDIILLNLLANFPAGGQRMRKSIILTILLGHLLGFSNPLMANCPRWLLPPPSSSLDNLPDFFPPPPYPNSALTELVMINSGGAALPGRAEDFLPRAAFAQKLAAQNISVGEDLQWAIAQALVTSAAGVLNQKKIRFHVLTESHENHVLSYLEIVPGEKHKINQLIQRIAQKYAHLQFVYHPYHLLHQHLDTAYEITRHQIYLGHHQIQNFNLRDLNLLHELRHAKRKLLWAQQVPSDFYGVSTSVFPEMMNYSIYHRQIMHDEPLVYFTEIKSLIYSWRRAWQHGKWRKQNLLRQKLKLYLGHALAISTRLAEIATFWPQAIQENKAKIDFYYAGGGIGACLKYSAGAHAEQTHLFFTQANNLEESNQPAMLHQKLHDLAQGSLHYQKVFTVIDDYFNQPEEKIFNEYAFKRLEQIFKGHHPH